MNFWGKIYGKDADYIICFALVSGGERWPQKQFFFCTKGSNLPLTRLEPLLAAGSLTTIDGGFSGDASLEVVEGTASDDNPDEIVGAISEANVVANCVSAYVLFSFFLSLFLSPIPFYFTTKHTKFPIPHANNQ